MSHDRNLNFLNTHRIVYRRGPISDKPDEVYDWGEVYHNGTYECYDLFRTKAKITTYKSLKWHFLVIQFLNEGESEETLESVFRFIANKENGFVTFFMKQKILDNMIKDVFDQGIDAPINKVRKVIFKPAAWHLTLSEKLSIVGKLIGRNKLTKETIYQCMLDINDANEKITIEKLAKLLNVTKRTIYRHMCDTLKQEKKILNEEL